MTALPLEAAQDGSANSSYLHRVIMLDLERVPMTRHRTLLGSVFVPIS